MKSSSIAPVRIRSRLENYAIGDSSMLGPIRRSESHMVRVECIKYRAHAILANN